MSLLVPVVVEKDDKGFERSYDIFSRLMKDRVICLNGEINDAVAAIVVAQLLFLEQDDPEKEISMYINSPGGSVSAGFAIHDTMQFIQSDVSTICVGIAASMGAFLLSAGTAGKRICLPNSEVMIHQPLGGAQGQASDIQIRADHIMATKARLNRMLSKYTGQALKKIETDTDRDNFMTAEEAIEYGLADKIVEKREKSEGSK